MQHFSVILTADCIKTATNSTDSFQSEQWTYIQTKNQSTLTSVKTNAAYVNIIQPNRPAQFCPTKSKVCTSTPPHRSKHRFTVSKSLVISCTLRKPRSIEKGSRETLEVLLFGGPLVQHAVIVQLLLAQDLRDYITLVFLTVFLVFLSVCFSVS